VCGGGGWGGGGGGGGGGGVNGKCGRRERLRPLRLKRPMRHQTPLAAGEEKIEDTGWEKRKDAERASVSRRGRKIGANGSKRRRKGS